MRVTTFPLDSESVVYLHFSIWRRANAGLDREDQDDLRKAAEQPPQATAGLGPPHTLQ